MGPAARTATGSGQSRVSTVPLCAHVNADVFVEFPRHHLNGGMEPGQRDFREIGAIAPFDDVRQST